MTTRHFRPRCARWRTEAPRSPALDECRCATYEGPCMERIPRQGSGTRRRLMLALAVACALIAALPALASAATFQVNTQDDLSGAGCPGACSIRRAIEAASDGDTVAIPAGHYKLDPANGVLFVSTDITIQGTGNPVIEGGGGSGVLAIGSGFFPNVSFPTVEVDGVTITGGDDSDNGGGGIVVYGELTLTNSTVSGNKSRYDGGGIALPGTEGPLGTLRLRNVTISGNKSGTDGGGISANGGNVTIV